MNQLQQIEAQFMGTGLQSTLWTPEFGWDDQEAEAAAAPYEQQLLAALQCFIALFSPVMYYIWVHLAAEMQAGKTGVMTALIRLVLANMSTLHIRPDHIFIVTGMSDKAWVKQTRERIPVNIRPNVFHGATLPKFEIAIRRLAARTGLRNVLIIIDESQLASSTRNRPNKNIYMAVNSLCPRIQWQTHNIRFITISATDPAKVLDMHDAGAPVRAEVVQLLTTEQYQSVERLKDLGRFRWITDFPDLNEPNGLDEIARCLTEEFTDEPLYHILRPRQKQQDAVSAALEARFPDCRVIKFDSERTIRQKDIKDGASSTDELEDINELLRRAPTCHTFIVLKSMFYASKTLHDEFVGIMWDRVAAKDDTNLQSLMGRACGYGKNSKTIIYVSKNTVDHYLKFWKELCSNKHADATPPGITIEKAAKQMPHLMATTTGLTSSLTHASPLTQRTGATVSGLDVKPDTLPKKPRISTVITDFTGTFKEYDSYDALRADFPHGLRNKKKDEDGFYLTSNASNSPHRMKYDAAIQMCRGKITTNMPRPSKVGGSTHRYYVGYRDVTDPTSGVYIVRTLTQIRASQLPPSPVTTDLSE